MRAVVERVARAEVRVDGAAVARIDRGLLALVGVGHADADADAEWLADKVVALRIFEDGAGLMNRSLREAGGALLAVSQFTLHGDCRKGRRPSFAHAMEPERARALFDRFCERARAGGARVETGRFGARMAIELVGDGPVTLLLDSKKAF